MTDVMVPVIPADIRGLATTAALASGLQPTLVLGLIAHESKGDTWAWNPEPKYRYLWDVVRNKPFRDLTAAEIASKIPPPDFRALDGDADNEWWGQCASWGLMQVMGGVAREMGFRGPYLTRLCSAPLNIDLGCKRLAALLLWSKGNVTQALAAYNGGKGGNFAPPYRNASYAADVLAMQAAIIRG